MKERNISIRPWTRANANVKIISAHNMYVMVMAFFAIG